MYILIDFKPFAKELPSNGDLFCEDFFHALFRNHPEHIFYLWTTGEDILQKKDRFEDYSNVRRVHTAIEPERLYRLVRFLQYPYIDDLVETLAMKNGHLPWVAKFDAIFYSTPFPTLFEDDCFHVQYTNHLKPLHYSELYTKKSLHYHSKKWYMKNIISADLNIVPSEFAKKEILEMGGDSDNFLISGIGITKKINKYIPHEENIQNHLQENNSLNDIEDAYGEKNQWDQLPKKFFFAQGDIHSLPIVIKAFELFRVRFPEEEWILIIEEPFIGSLSTLGQWYKVEILPPLEIKHKELLLSKCFGFIEPSLYEPTGKKVLEAMRCGAPIISSNHGALPEICPNNTLFFDPLSFSDLFQQMKKLYKDTLLHKNLSEKGILESHLEKFSWDDITITIIKEITRRLEKREFEE